MKIKHSKQSKTLHPRLDAVLKLVYAKRPLLEYVVIEENDEGAAREVEVWQDGQYIGKVDSHYRRHSPSKGMTEIWYAVTSDKVRKGRGQRNTKFSKDPKTTARNAIELLEKKPLSALGSSLIMSVKTMVEHLRDRTLSDYKNSISFSSLSMTNYFIDKQLGKNPPTPKSIQDQILSKDLLRKRDNLDVAENVMEHCKRNNGYALQVMQDDTLLFAHLGSPETTSKNNSTYELDQYSQEKYAMLKLLDINQFAADIGVKFDYDNKTIYFIVAGKTKVM